MSPLVLLILLLLRRTLPHADVRIENLALRQQLAVYQRSPKRPKLRRRDRIFWVWLKRLWPRWRSALVIVQPDTVCRWHRAGFRMYWRFKSRPRDPGRPKIEREIRQLVRRMARDNPTWGAPRIQSELRLVGHDVAQSTVSKYLPRAGKPRSPGWHAFLKNHAGELAAVDFFTVPTATLRVLYVFVVLSIERRHVLHFNVTANPSAEWTAQQVVEAFPFDPAPRYLQRDRDGIYGREFQTRVENLGIEQVVSAPRSPWQNPYAERPIGRVPCPGCRRECLDHVIVLNETHLKRILTAYFGYYQNSRTHLALDRNAPEPREPEPPERGSLIAIPQAGGLPHRYTRAA